MRILRLDAEAFVKSIENFDINKHLTVVLNYLSTLSGVSNAGFDLQAG